ncbi:protein sevenless-like isoform X2 [Saccostrea cucullata]
MDVILFEKEFVSLEFNNSKCVSENLGRIFIQFESFDTRGFVCALSNAFACLGLFADTGYIKCPFSRDKSGFSLYGTDENKYCRNPYFTTTEFKRLSVTSNDDICTVAFNVTALAHRREITVSLELIGKERSQTQEDKLRTTEQQTITFSFPLLDDKIIKYYLKVVIWLDIELFDEIQFKGVSMSPGCFRVLVTEKDIERIITGNLATGDLSNMMNKSTKGSPNEDTRIPILSNKNSYKVIFNDTALIITIVALGSALIFGVVFKLSRNLRKRTIEVKTSAICDAISGTGLVEDNICKSNPNYSWYQSSCITGRINNFHFKDLKMFEEIGNGHFGIVRRGKILSTSTPVALKELKPYSTAVEKMDFLLEAITLCKLRHSNIVRCFGISTSQQRIFILLELMDEDLKTHLRKHRVMGVPIATIFSQTHSLKLAIDVCRACVYLEEIKFIHRDIAARNCLISRHESQVVVKIADFGMARDVTMTQYYVKEGTCKVPVRWMSPESMLNGRFSSKTDIWAFGVLMWEIYTGAQLPYGDFTIDVVMNHIIQGGKLDKPTKCSNDVWQIMQMCWLDCADERPSFRDLEQSLQMCLTSADEQGSEGNTENTILL